MSPIHVRGEPGDFAESVLLPGDPRRAKYIARKFFEDARLGTEERGMLGYTGAYNGELRLGGLAGAPAATPNDGTVSSLPRGIPYAPAAHFDIVHAAFHAG